MHRNDMFPTTEGMTDREVGDRQRDSQRVTNTPTIKPLTSGNTLCERFVHPFPLRATYTKIA